MNRVRLCIFGQCRLILLVFFFLCVLSSQEVRLGEEIAWYADGDTIVRGEQNHSIAYAYDRVFGPTTTTRHVYDAAALHVISGAMEGIYGI
ncbi:hypothetical protein ZEAMMB73_Zm00001d044862 [Zea mays]|uniref:Uncharacterized protein n=1 Tax=Zea mays TaxID=4577 RepID=A0A1D6NRX7_MAIZE|nr:hypothetical protein ZEAMMB73_Zm00001d044862 [Zea mays]